MLWILVWKGFQESKNTAEHTLFVTNEILQVLPDLLQSYDVA